VSLLALSTVQGYHGYVLFVWLYGVCLGGFLYSLKMFTMERVKSRYFTRAWGFVQGAEAIPVLVGVPITGSCFKPQLESFLVPGLRSEKVRLFSNTSVNCSQKKSLKSTVKIHSVLHSKS
jgi:hypothetical protein